MANTLDVLVKVKADTSGLGKLGGDMSKYVTLPILAAGAAVIKLASDAEETDARLTAAFESMGAASWTSLEELRAKAAELMSKTTFDDEAIGDAQAVLLTFGNVTGEAFDEGTLAALNLSSALGTDLQSATIMVGKALNDPIKGITAMGRAGIQFSEDQKAMIARLVETGDIAGAQAIILGELEKQFGGMAESMAQTSGGQMKQAMNELANAGESIGKLLVPILATLAGHIRNLAALFQNLSPEAKAIVVQVLAMVAVIGPLLVIGAKLAALFTTLKVAFVAVKAGVVTMIPALAAKAAAWFAVAAGVIAANAPLLIIIGIIAAVVAALVWAYNNVKGFRDIVDAAFRIVGQVASALGDIFRRVFDAIGKVVGAVMGLIRGYFDNILFPIFRAVGAGLSILGGVFSRIFDGIRNAVSTAINAVLGVFRNLWSGIQSVGRSIMTFLGGLFKPLADSINSVLSIVKNAWNAFARMWNGVQLNIPRIDIPNPFGGFITLGGGSIGLPDIPTFAKGGILTGPTLGVFGEAGPEAVIPLSRAGALGGNTYNITVQTGVGDPVAIGREIVDAIRAYERANGPVLA